MDFRDAFSRLQSDTDLAGKFIDDPEGVLKIMGVDTSELVIQHTVGAKEPLRAVSQLRRRAIDEPAAAPTICASIGFIVCATVGGEVDWVEGGMDFSGPVSATQRKSKR